MQYNIGLGLIDSHSSRTVEPWTSTNSPMSDMTAGDARDNGRQHQSIRDFHSDWPLSNMLLLADKPNSAWFSETG